MRCTSPLSAYRSRPGAEHPITFNPRNGLSDTHFEVRCGKCVACRLHRANEWGIRAYHEAQMHPHSTYATLTIAPEHYPADGCVSPRVLQLLHKKMRNHLGPFRFMACGEYGGQGFRAHYHAVYFGLEFPDKYFWRESPRGDRYFRSPTLENLWGFGHVEISDVTLQSSRYVAGYAMKKINGDAAPEHYRRVHPHTGEIVQLTPEFIQMSRHPGIGQSWFLKYKSDVFPRDFVIVEGKRQSVPRYYDSLLPEDELQEIVAKRIERGQQASFREAMAHARSGYGQARDLTRDIRNNILADRLNRGFGGESL